MKQLSLRPKRRRALEADALQTLVHSAPHPVDMEVLKSTTDILDLHTAWRIRIPLRRERRLADAAQTLVGRQGSAVFVFGRVVQFVK